MEKVIIFIEEFSVLDAAQIKYIENRKSYGKNKSKILPPLSNMQPHCIGNAQKKGGYLYCEFCKTNSSGNEQSLG